MSYLQIQFGSDAHEEGSVECLGLCHKGKGIRASHIGR